MSDPLATDGSSGVGTPLSVNDDISGGLHHHQHLPILGSSEITNYFRGVEQLERKRRSYDSMVIPSHLTSTTDMSGSGSSGMGGTTSDGPHHHMHTPPN